METERLEIQKLENERLDNQNLEIKEEQKCELKLSENDIKIKEVKGVEDLKLEQEIIPKKENEEQIIDVNVQTEIVSQKSPNDESTTKNMHEDLEVPDTMEVIQVTEVLSCKLIDEPIAEDIKPSSPPIVQEILPDEIKPKSPPISTMTCSIDGNNDTEWNVPVAPATGTIKININQKIAPAVKLKTPIEEMVDEQQQSSSDFSPTFGEIDPGQPPPPGLEMETVVAPKIQRELKPRLMNNVKKLKEYPIVNRGKEMSGLCSIM